MWILVYLLLFLTLTDNSSATYCVCRDGIGDQSLQKTLDYACGAGADCTPILQNGACFQPNTVKDHCNWAVNSYFQRKGQTTGSCDFSGTAMPSQAPPSNVQSTCIYPSSPGTAGTTPTASQTTPSTTSPNTGFNSPPTTTAPGGFGTTSPGSGGIGTSPPGSGSIGTSPPGGVGTSPMFGGGGISPTGSGFTDNTGRGVPLSKCTNVLVFYYVLLALFSI